MNNNDFNDSEVNDSSATLDAGRSCPRCQSPIPAGASDELCPACLMSQALAAPDGETLSWDSGLATAESEAGSWPQTLGDYRLLRWLGRGGMGQVYEAEHQPTGRRVALKRLGKRLDSPATRQRFLREGRLAASVSHPHSLYVFGSEEIEGTPVITMEVAESGTLKDELAKRGPLPVEEAVDAILDVIEGLEAARTVGVLHRDVKPSNCFRGPDGSVKIGDYGLSVSVLSRDDSYATATGMIMGTPAYASPEQLRGDDLDHRADIYSVGATLFTLLTGRAPFEGQNAVQVVANAVNLPPKKLSDLREGLPPGLERIVSRCLAKEPGGRFDSYRALRDALLPFSSRQNEPVPMKVRASAGWVDFLLAFLVPYIILMLLAGSVTFHFGWLMERSLASARYYLAFLGFGLLYFTLAEGLGGAGFGKRRKGLQVIRPDGRRPGPLRALIRILVPILSIQVLRLPLLFSTITATRVEELTVRQNLIYLAATILLPFVPALLGSTARRANGYATPWDLLSGTRVVFRPTGVERPAVEPLPLPKGAAAQTRQLGPYLTEREIVRDRWLTATDTVLRRPVWLIRRQDGGPSEARRVVSRPGRPRWLQKVEDESGVWDAYEASPGAPLRSRIADGRRICWSDLRHWLHDLAAELWAASPEGTLPARLSLDHVWLTAGGRALLLDLPWPTGAEPAESVPVDDLAGQQRFLHAVAEHVEVTNLPLHARGVLQNLAEGRFEKLSFLAGTLRGLLERPATLDRWVRTGALFMIPAYSLVMTLVGSQESAAELEGHFAGFFGSFTFFAILLIAAIAGIVQLLLVPFRTTNGHTLFRLAVVDAGGRLASRRRLLARWAVAWLPLVAALGVTAILQPGLGTAWPRVWFALWLVAALQAALDPHRGLHDRLAGTWVVRR